MPEHEFVLKFVAGQYLGDEVVLRPARSLLIGRAPEQGMVLAEDRVSRKHAVIGWEQEQPVLEDLGSTNGTWVNGEPVQRSPLHVGDRIIIGTSMLQVCERAPGDGEGNPGLVRTPLTPPHRQPVMSGQLKEVPLLDLLQLLQAAKKSGELVVRGALEGRLWLQRGAVQHASLEASAELGARKALCRLLHAHGTFELWPPEREPVELPPGPSLFDALGDDEALRALAARLPDLRASVSVTLPPVLEPALTEAEFSLVRLIARWGSLQGVFDHSPVRDAELAETFLRLERRGCLKVASQFAALVAGFPSLAGAPGISPWDAPRLLRWLCSGGLHGGEALAARFLLGVWNPQLHWVEEARRMGAPEPEAARPFLADEAQGVWDAAHWSTYHAWSASPFPAGAGRGVH
jgi:pSer/pThr/pTyr-binding forkhead associated (FHA) protein